MHCPYCLEPYDKAGETCGKKLCADRTKAWNRWKHNAGLAPLPPRMGARTVALLDEHARAREDDDDIGENYMGGSGGPPPEWEQLELC